MLTDTAFSQTAVTVLVATMLALMLQARLLGNHTDHPISSNGRVVLAVIELFLTTTLSIVAVGIGYLLIQHLASDDHPFRPADRSAIAHILLLLLTGLGFIAILNRIIPYAWKVPPADDPRGEPELDTSFLGGLWVSFVGAAGAAGTLLQLTGHLGAQWLMLLFDGGLVAASAAWTPVLSLRFNRYYARRGRARLIERGYEEGVAYVVLPGGAGQFHVTVYRPREASGPVCLASHDAWQLRCHFNAARRRMLVDDPSGHTDVPDRLRLRLRARDSRLALASRRPLGQCAPWSWCRRLQQRLRESRPATEPEPLLRRTLAGKRRSPPIPTRGFVSVSGDVVPALHRSLRRRPRSPG
jgi:hypothetical protein